MQLFLQPLRLMKYDFTGIRNAFNQNCIYNIIIYFRINEQDEEYTRI